MWFNYIIFTNKPSMSNHYWPWGSKSWLSALLGRSRKNVPKKHSPRSFSVDLIVGLDSSLFPCCWSSVGYAHVARAPSYQRASCAHPKKRVEYECLKGRNFDKGVRGQKNNESWWLKSPFQNSVSIWNFLQKFQNASIIFPARWLDQFCFVFCNSLQGIVELFKYTPSTKKTEEEPKVLASHRDAFHVHFRTFLFRKRRQVCNKIPRNWI